jgi:quinol-cytochrome oxidoreductase complex cytochrome b subunit
MLLRRLSIFIAYYFVQLRIAFHELPALIGFFLFMTIFNQLVSGTMLAFSLVTESMYIPLAREEEDSENLYTDDFFWLHERGVDLLVIFMFAHLFRKIYINALDIEQEGAWKSGVLLFLLTQVVIFLGLVLCCTHLSDVTLTIAVNAFHTFCLFTGKLYWLIFPDQTLNSDTITRLAYLHYVLAFVLAYLSIYHGIDMHYDWKPEEAFDGVKQELNWYDEALINEIGQTINVFIILGILCLYLYTEPEALHYELFMWGDVGMSTDIRFLGVAPHWYFRPYMHWLIACPFHYTGLLGIILFFISFYFQPNIVGLREFKGFTTGKTIFDILYFYTIMYTKRIAVVNKPVTEIGVFYRVTYAIFLCSLWYVFSYLPFGRFFNSLGGNGAGLLAFSYIFIYMSGTFLRIPRGYILYTSLAK